jgi:hypothetical protein
MSWKTVATVLITVFAIALVQATAIGPLFKLTDELSDDGDYNNEYYSVRDRIDGFVSSWINMGLVGIFGMMAYGAARVVRKELTRGQL